MEFIPSQETTIVASGILYEPIVAAKKRIHEANHEFYLVAEFDFISLMWK
jgi:hypothetical protein